MAILLVAAYVYMNSGRYVETDNAYVKSDTALITAEVGGRIESVAVSENQRVRAGDVLFRIDSKPYELAVERAQSQLEAVESFIESLEASYEQQLAQLELAKINIAFYEREFEREQELVESRAGTGADLDEARHDLEVARQQIPIIEQSIAQLRAQIGGQIVFGSAAGAAAVGSSLFSSNAAYRTVKSMVADARLDLDRVVVRAPFDGVVTQVPTVGRFVAPGSLVMALISDQDVWLEANYKETQLTHVEPGQRVTIHVDAYPESEWNGEVESISPATGAEFSVIPAQNASGNWVKVAQRVPVRIRVVDELQGPQLRAGMSAIVEVDTGFERPAPSFLGFLAVLRTSAATETVGTGDQG
ncbi:MAG: HlyD family secretion protein [Gammaproteobacteria bacterium]|jgi:membrane fusion protein (multidrug efflux system)